MQEPSNETWLPVVGFEGRYEVSNFGNVRSITWASRWGVNNFRTPRPCKPWRSKEGYFSVKLSDGNGNYFGRRICRLVASAFIRQPNSGEQVNHLDGNKQNDRAENLEWTTPLGNIRHAINSGLIKGGEARSFPQKLNREKVTQIRAMIGLLSKQKIADAFGVSKRTIEDIKTRKTWAWI